MNRQELFRVFSQMFPDLASAVIECRKVGAKTIALRMANDRILFFLYYDRDNWNLGTKQWRKCPNPPKNKEV